MNEDQPLLSSTSGPTTENLDSSPTSQTGQEISAETETAQTIPKGSYLDWIPAIIVGIIFTAITLLIFSQVGLKNSKGSVIYADKFEYLANSTNLNILCTGSKECRVNIQQDRKHQNVITVGWFVESTLNQGMKYAEIDVRGNGSVVFVQMNSTLFPSESEFIVTFNIFLPWSISPKFSIDGSIVVGSLLVKETRDLNYIDVEIGKGDITVEELSLKSLSATVKDGNVKANEIQIRNKVSANTFYGDLDMNIKFLEDEIGSKHAALTAQDGNINSLIKGYKSMIITGDSGNINLVCESPDPKSNAKIISKVGTITILMESFFGSYDVSSTTGNIKLHENGLSIASHRSGQRGDDNSSLKIYSEDGDIDLSFN